MRCPVTIVQIVKAARETLVKGLGRTQCQLLVITDREARGVDGASLGRRIELELKVRGNVSDSILEVLENAVFQGQDQAAVGIATFLFFIELVTSDVWLMSGTYLDVALLRILNDSDLEVTII